MYMPHLPEGNVHPNFETLNEEGKGKGKCTVLPVYHVMKTYPVFN